MKKVILHIGTEKTGSSTIQQWLAENRRVLKKNSILYPLSPGYMTHACIAAYGVSEASREHLTLTYKLDRNDFRKKFEQRFYKEINKHNCQKIILSSEHCSSYLKNEESVNYVVKLLKEISQDIQIIMYVRRQDFFWVSKYSTEVIVGKEEDISYPSLNESFMYDYFKIANLWERSVGKGNVKVRVFDSKSFVNNNLIEDFFDFSGIQSLDFSEFSDTNVKANQSFTAEQIEFIKVFNKYVPAMTGCSFNRLRGRYIGDAIKGGENDKEKYYPTSEETEYFKEKYSESNELLRVNYLPELDAPLFDFQFANEKTSRSISVETAIKIAAYMWMYQRNKLLERNKYGPLLYLRTLVRKAKQRITSISTL